MFATDQETAATSLPTPAAAGTPGFFTGGNPATGVAATILDADWLNMVQAELLAILTAGSVSPSKTVYNQVLAALKVIFAASAGSTSQAFSVAPSIASTQALAQSQIVLRASNNSGTGTSLATSISWTPTKSGKIKVSGNGGCSSSAFSGVPVNTTGATLVGGAANFGAQTSLCIVELVYSVVAGTAVTISFGAQTLASTTISLGMTILELSF